MAKKKATKPVKKAAPKKAAPKKAAPKKAMKKAPKKAVKKPAKKAVAPKKAAMKKEAAPKAPKAPAKKAPPTPPAKASLSVPKGATRQYTQSEFFDCVHGFCGFNSRKEAKEFYGNFSELIQGALKSGYKVVLPGLGKFQVRKTKARKGINPMTRQPINIPARRKVAFTAMKALKEAVL